MVQELDVALEFVGVELALDVAAAAAALELVDEVLVADTAAVVLALVDIAPDLDTGVVEEEELDNVGEVHQGLLFAVERFDEP